MGRPNVGKSALFNRLVRRREALVHDTPGGHVTRDYQEGVAKLADLRCARLLAVHEAAQPCEGGRSPTCGPRACTAAACSHQHSVGSASSAPRPPAYDLAPAPAAAACRRFKVVDTSGLEPFLPGDTIQARATTLTARVLSRADVTLLLLDGQ